MVTLLSKNNCNQCVLTEKLFKRKGVEYEVFKMDEDESAITRAKELGYLQAPVVLAPGGVHWSGFRPDLIEKHL